MKNRLDRDCVLLDGKCDCWIPMKECKYLPVNVNETEKQVRKKDTTPISVYQSQADEYWRDLEATQDRRYREFIADMEEFGIVWRRLTRPRFDPEVG
jgi:hypothetical protein